MTKHALFCFSMALLLVGCADEDNRNYTDEHHVKAPVNLSFQVVNQFPHDTAAFTEGFSFYAGELYESTGSPSSPPTNGTWIAKLDLATGQYDRKVDLGTSYFGEGMTFLNDKVFQLTWTTKKGFIYDAKTFKKLGEFSYASEGWGLTNNGIHLIMSTGSNNLYFLDPESLQFVRTLAVQDNKGFVSNLNELEYIEGYVYANQWMTPYILKIDPQTGHVVAKMDFTRQVNEIKSKHPYAEEMNGIAYDSLSRKTYITGKKWPFVYEIKW